MRCLHCELSILNYSSCFKKTKFLILLWNETLNKRQDTLHTRRQAQGSVVGTRERRVSDSEGSPRQIFQLVTSASNQSRVLSRPCEGNDYHKRH